MKRRRTLALICVCGRNLAGVTKPMRGDGPHAYPSNPTWTNDGLMVSPRPNVEQDDYRPWHEANKNHKPDGKNAHRRPPEDLDYDWKDHTYTWKCRCGRAPTLRHERITATWQERADEPYDPAKWRLVVDG